jgi:hypothetical protein
VRLIGKSTAQRDVTQAGIRGEHILRGQFHATLHDERVRRLPERTLEGSREVRFAQSEERAQIRDEHATCDVPINVVT